ncbi:MULTISPECIES: pre-peptidase C-terminal domain-containing protein [unclassified Leptolyngbya]|uniref:pre-peptidase C-terminal domain-containing protein n=1 Tax=unclassified Leptolyngbya TaxID=2650499 RepID=UPI001685CD42|nr:MULTISPECIES: pre-peptidase C-terminal domain-containing protein [unclassified Leptolyngbya]MBD1910960.1 pre-peptidase C-terminal domain-containing protein [Leptolyngbya sp. FACHB-8]MBD2158373.1 pre-peptidase C-terminal domain-containing protein [Leptolyngbya sp. FACHB-16]
MTSWKNGSWKLGCMLATAIALGGISLVSIAPAARAQQTLFEEQGNLQPMEDEYTFSGTAGQTVTIAMNSDVFDTLLVLRGPNGQDVTMNDDYARSLNSTIVATLPTTGTYTVLARSFSGQGGAYRIVVRPATAYDQAYARGFEQLRNGQMDQAIASFTDAIGQDPNQPIVYLDRGDAYYSQGNIQGVVADYTRAAELYERAGDTMAAQGLREQLEYMRSNPTPMPMPMPMPMP